MKIPYPEDYFGKNLRVTLTDGEVIDGRLYGFDYDFNDQGEAFLEFDVESEETGLLYGLTEEVIKEIKIL